uniref:Tritrans,polycis-undecaprenyl-diphosphate synthase (geranylgeranyl-diphosphate specific) n=1 Tax=Ignisphaera aggregans TaxID=334771 RepID=A0A7C2ZP27_9CREN
MPIVKKVKHSLLDKTVDLLLNPKIGKILKPFIGLIYSFYEHYLLKQITSKPMPRHVAIIPDGNRRWAKEHGLDPNDGHEQGYRKMKDVLNWLYELGINIVTVYAMSYENCLRRSGEERKNLFNLIRRGLMELDREKILDRYKVKFKVFGKLDLADRETIDIAKKLEEKTSQYNERFLNVAICYGGRQEILDAIRFIAKEFAKGRINDDEITEETILKYLSTGHLPFPEPDLVIRTSGELRISNFLLWQIAYSELYFCDVYWPDFRKIDLYRAIRSYQNRERRFGA